MARSAERWTVDIEPLGGYAFSSEARNAPLLHGMDETDQPFVSVMVDFEAERGWIRKVRARTRKQSLPSADGLIFRLEHSVKAANRTIGGYKLVLWRDHPTPSAWQGHAAAAAGGGVHLCVLLLLHRVAGDAAVR